MIWLAYIGCNQVVAVLALCFSVGLNGFMFSGFHVDIVHV